MTLVAFDLAELTGADPYSALARVRAVDPVARIADSIWAVTGYEAAMETMRHRAFVSGPIGAMYREVLPPGAARDEMSNRINFLDPPDHTRVRGIVSKAFTPRRVSDLRPGSRRPPKSSSSAWMRAGRSTCSPRSRTCCRRS